MACSASSNTLKPAVETALGTPPCSQDGRLLCHICWREAPALTTESFAAEPRHWEVGLPVTAEGRQAWVTQHPAAFSSERGTSVTTRCAILESTAQLVTGDSSDSQDGFVFLVLLLRETNEETEQGLEGDTQLLLQAM